MATQTVQSKISKKRVRLDCGNYLVRTVKIEDASERWGNWLANAEACFMLNAPARPLKKSEIVSYIKSFDQRSHLLLGVFEKSSWKHLGIFKVDLDHEKSEFLVSMLIGDPEYRHRRVTSSISQPCREYFFGTLGLKTARATVLAHNSPAINYLRKFGWTLDKTPAQRVKSRANDTMLDLCVYSLTRDVWLASKQATAPQQSPTMPKRPK